MKKYSDKTENNCILGYKINENSEPTNELVKLSFEDRFKHTLILGPAGIGKTFQCITPMIWSDMQIKNKTVGITVLAVDNCLAEKTYAMAIHHNNQIDEALANGTYKKDQHGEKKTIQYFNPILKDCPYFNPLEGHEDNVIENIANTFCLMNTTSTQFVQDLEDIVVRNAVKVLKRLYGDEATFSDLKTLICDPDVGKTNYIMPLKSMQVMVDGSPVNPLVQKEHEELVNWFLMDYYAGANGESGMPKTYQKAEHLRKIIEKINSNKSLNRILNPPRNGSEDYETYLSFQKECLKQNLFYKINFDEALKQGHIVAINTNEYNLRELSRFLNYFFIFQLQSAIYKRAGGKYNRIPNMIYIKDFDNFSNLGFSDILKISSAYRVAFHLSVHSLKLLGKNFGEFSRDFCTMIINGINNHIVYGGVFFDDAKLYSDRDMNNALLSKHYYNPLYRTISFMLQPKIIYGKNIDPPQPLYVMPTNIIDQPFGCFIYQTSHKDKIKTCHIKATPLSRELNDLLEQVMVLETVKRC